MGWDSLVHCKGGHMAWDSFLICSLSSDFDTLSITMAFFFVGSGWVNLRFITSHRIEVSMFCFHSIYDPVILLKSVVGIC